MIFATVGTQGPFDRMVGALDRWAARNDSVQVYAQIGTGPPPARIGWVDFLDAAAFRTTLERAELVVSHAGIGTLLLALEFGKPIVVMPRRAELGEQRNDHQLATAKHFCEHRGIRVVHEAEELARALDDLRDVIPSQRIRPSASDELLLCVREFIAASGARQRTRSGPRPSPPRS